MSAIAQAAPMPILHSEAIADLTPKQLVPHSSRRRAIVPLKPKPEMPDDGLTPDERERFHFYVGKYESAQRMRMGLGNQSRAMLRYGFGDTGKAAVALFIRTENGAAREFTRLVKKHRLFPWLTAHKGIGPILAARWLHNLMGHHFEEVSDLWAFCRLDGSDWNVCQPVTKRYRGSKKMRSIAWLQGKAFKQYGGTYGAVVEARMAYTRTLPGCGKSLTNKKGEVYSDCSGATCSELHMERKAKVYAVKDFLKDFWIEWRKGIPASD